MITQKDLQPQGNSALTQNPQAARTVASGNPTSNFQPSGDSSILSDRYSTGSLRVVGSASTEQGALLSRGTNLTPFVLSLSVLLIVLCLAILYKLLVLIESEE